VVPSKRGGGSEAEVRGDGSASLGLHARGGRIVPLKKKLNKESPVAENSTKNHFDMGGIRSRI